MLHAMFGFLHLVILITVIFLKRRVGMTLKVPALLDMFWFCCVIGYVFFSFCCPCMCIYIPYLCYRCGSITVVVIYDSCFSPLCEHWCYISFIEFVTVVVCSVLVF